MPGVPTSSLPMFAHIRAVVVKMRSVTILFCSLSLQFLNFVVLADGCGSVMEQHVLMHPRQREDQES